jgi:hypothetical protein
MVSRASRESGERVAEQPGIRAVAVRVAAMAVDEPAELVDVLDGVLQRRLPAGKQRDNE